MVGFLAELGESIIRPLASIWVSVVNTLPGLLGALVVLVVGYFVGVFLGQVVEHLLTRLKVEKFLLEKTNVARVLGYFRLSHFVGLVIKWYVFILFLTPAASITRLIPLAYFMLEVARWIPQVIAAVIIALVGVMAGDYVEYKVQETRAKAADLIGASAKILIVLFTALIVFDQIGIRVSVAQTSFLIVLSGPRLGFAIMIGIGFGFGPKDDAKLVIRKIKRKL